MNTLSRAIDSLKAGLSWLIWKTEYVYSGPNNQSLIINLKLSDDGWGNPSDFKRMDWLERRLEKKLKKQNLGEVDGMERGLGYLTFFTYGVDADAMYDVVIDTIRAYPPRPGSYLMKRESLNDEGIRIDL